MRLKTLLAFAGLIVSAQVFAQSPSFQSVERQQFGDAPQGAPAPASCSADATVSQALVSGEFSSAFTSDAGAELLTADTYVNGGAAEVFPPGFVATEATIWGIQLEFDPAFGFVGPCDPDQADFDIALWTDNGGVPDSVVSSTTASPTVTDLQIPFALGANVHEFNIPFGAISSTDATWFSIQRQASPDTGGGNQCFFLWVNQNNPTNADNLALSIVTGDGSLIPRDTDVSACLEGTVLPVSQPVPVNNMWAMGLMVLLLAGLGIVVIRRMA